MRFGNQSKRIQKKILKLSKKLFGIDSFPVLFKTMLNAKSSLEEAVGKHIQDFTDEDIKRYPFQYSIWKTMNKICDIYLLLVELRCFDTKEFLEEETKWIQEDLKK